MASALNAQSAAHKPEPASAAATHLHQRPRCQLGSPLASQPHSATSLSPRAQPQCGRLWPIPAASSAPANTSGPSTGPHVDGDPSPGPSGECPALAPSFNPPPRAGGVWWGRAERGGARCGALGAGRVRRVGAVLPAVQRAKRPFLRADSGRVEVLGEAAGRTGRHRRCGAGEADGAAGAGAGRAAPGRGSVVPRTCACSRRSTLTKRHTSLRSNRAHNAHRARPP